MPLRREMGAWLSAAANEPFSDDKPIAFQLACWPLSTMAMGERGAKHGAQRQDGNRVCHNSEIKERDCQDSVFRNKKIIVP